MLTMHIKAMRDLRAIGVTSVQELGVVTPRNWFMLGTHHYEIERAATYSNVYCQHHLVKYVRPTDIGFANFGSTLEFL